MGHISTKLAILQLKITQVSENGVLLPRKNVEVCEQVRGQCLRIRLKIAKKCGLYLDIFSCVKMNGFRSFFAFRLEMHVRCDNQYKSGADKENILGHGYLRFEPGP